MTSYPIARRSASTAILLAFYGVAIALVPGIPAKIILAAPLLLIPLVWWTMSAPNRWLFAFIGTAWLLPPLPFEVGSGGPHVALLFAAIGVFAGTLTFLQWRIKIDWLSGSLLLLLAALLISCVPAFVYSGFEVGAGTVTRVLLFGIPVYTFLYVRDGPFQFDAKRLTALVRFIFWTGLASAVLAWLDFYFQFPAAPGHSVQFIWLDSGMYRRAQGVFYESSTLGNLCVFVLVAIAAAWLQPSLKILPKWILLIGAVPIVIALFMSYSRGSLISLGVGIFCLLAIKCEWSQWKRALGIAVPALVVSGVAALKLSPALAQAAWMRLVVSVQYFWTAPDAVLSGRLSNWTTLGDFMVEEPWKLILGLGYKTLPVSGISGSPLIADNTYLSALVETGVIGISALAVLNIAITARSYRAARSRNPHRAFLGTWIFCFWTGETVQMLSGDLLTYWRILPAFFCIVALADREPS